MFEPIVRKTGKGWLVESKDICVRGEGETPEAALRDFADYLFERRAELRGENDLSIPLQWQLELMEGVHDG